MATVTPLGVAGVQSNGSGGPTVSRFIVLRHDPETGPELEFYELGTVDVRSSKGFKAKAPPASVIPIPLCDVKQKSSTEIDLVTLSPLPPATIRLHKKESDCRQWFLALLVAILASSSPFKFFFAQSARMWSNRFLGKKLANAMESKDVKKLPKPDESDPRAIKPTERISSVPEKLSLDSEYPDENENVNPSFALRPQSASLVTSMKEPRGRSMSMIQAPVSSRGITPSMSMLEAPAERLGITPLADPPALSSLYAKKKAQMLKESVSDCRSPFLM